MRRSVEFYHKPLNERTGDRVCVKYLLEELMAPIVRRMELLARSEPAPIREEERHRSERRRDLIYSEKSGKP